MFVGASAATRATVRLDNLSPSVSTASGVESGYRLSSDGKVYWKDDSNSVKTDWEAATGAELTSNWITPVGAAGAAYEVRATKNSGDTLDVDSSALSSWLALSSNREWMLTNSSNGTEKSTNLTIEIRSSTSEGVLDSCTVVLTTENT